MPIDKRRNIWIKHSDNRILKITAENTKSPIKFCENHFYIRYLYFRYKKNLNKNIYPISFPNILLPVTTTKIKNAVKLKIFTEETCVVQKMHSSQDADYADSSNDSPFLEDHHLSLEGNRSPAGPNLKTYSNRLRNICLPNLHYNNETNGEQFSSVPYNSNQCNKLSSCAKVPRFTYI